MGVPTSLTERFGIKHLSVGLRVEDDCYGRGVVTKITPLPNRPWFPEGFTGGEVEVLLDDGKLIVTESSTLLLECEFEESLLEVTYIALVPEADAPIDCLTKRRDE